MHPRLEEIRNSSPPMIEDEHVGLNGRIAVRITKMVGSMACAYFFAALALISLPDAIRGGVATTISWIAQTFLQLVLLSVILIGTNIQGAASDKRAAETYKDTEAILSELHEIKQTISKSASSQ